MKRISQIAAAMALVSCAVSPTGQACDPVVATERPDPNDPDLKNKLPPLCDLSGGRWCLDGGCAAGECGTRDEGALCCSGGVCVKWLGGSCGGDLGWCNNYTTAKDPDTGIDVATCHD